jgi:chromosome segregation ATPase
MELFGLHVPGTRDKDAEITKLKRELEDKDRELEVSESLRRKYFEEKIDAAVNLRQKEEAMVGQLRSYEEHSGQLKAQNRELTGEIETYRTAFNALAVMQGLNPDLS